MSHLDLDPIEENRKRHEQKLKLEIWYRNLSLGEKRKLQDFTTRLALFIAELKEERRR